MKTLSDLLYEGAAEPEAPEGSIYGQYLFAPRRSGEVPEEPNTEPEETRLFDALRDFMGSDNNHEKLQSLVPEILEVMKRHDYAPVLDAGSVKVYRGMTLPQKTLEDMSAGASTTKEVLKAGRGVDAPEVTYFAVSKQGKLNPREKKSILQSWTTDLSVALMFSLEGEYGGDEMGVPVVFVANTSDSMFFGQPQKLSSIVRQNYYEKETISIGPVTYSGFVYAIPLDQGLGPDPRSVNPKKLKELVNKL
jgi:hypothetical protein